MNRQIETEPNPVREVARPDEPAERFLRQLLTATTVSAAAQAAVDSVRQTISADVSWCGIVEDGVLKMAAHSGLRTTEMMSSWHLAVAEGIGGRTVSEGRTHTVRDYRRDSRRVADMKSVIDEEAIHGAMCAPLPVGSTVIGVLYAAHRTPRDWTSAEVHLITEMGKDAGVAIGRILAREAERLTGASLTQLLGESRRTLSALKDLTAALERSRDVGSGVDILAHRLGMVVELLTLDGDTLRVAPAPVGEGQELQASLAIGEGPIATLRAWSDRPLTGAEDDLFVTGAQAIGLQLARERAALQAELRLHSEFVNELLLGPDLGSQTLRDRAALLGLELARPRCVLAVGVHGTSAPGGKRPSITKSTLAAVQSHFSGEFPGAIVAPIDGGAVVLVPTEDEAHPASMRARVAKVLHHIGASHQLSSGIGRVCRGVQDYPTSYTEALLGLDIACRRPSAGEVLAAADLGLYGLLAQGAARGSLESIVQTTLGPLIEADERTGSDYVKTLDTYLANDRHLERTATTLHLHVNTVRYRLNKVLDNLGVDLHDVDTRFLLELALRVRAALDRSDDGDRPDV